MSLRHYVDTMRSAAVTGLILETFRLNGSLLAVGDELVRDLGLTSARWQVLGAIAMAEHPLPVAGLARTIGLARQGVQRIVDDLAGTEHVVFAPNPHHRRAKLVLLSERGSAVYADAVRRQGPWAEALGADLPIDAITAATALLRSLRDRLDSANAERDPA